MKRCLIVCDGTIDKILLLSLLKTYQRNLTIIAADGAANTLYRFRLKPDYIAGDLDSIKPSVVAYYKRQAVKIVAVPEQEHTDLEKCIRLALRLRFRTIRIIGYSGKRIDHTINNFSILMRYYRRGDIRFLDSDFEVFYTDKGFQANCRKGDVVSFLGMPKAKGVVTEGLVYSLSNEDIEFGVREGALNEAAEERVRIGMKKGILLVFRKHHSIY
jgi:thiamine pyrophosphokinase